MKHILLVDDDELVRFALSMALEMAGFKVTQAEHGADPVITEVIRQTPPDLVISDLIMPEKEGIELLMELKSQHPSLPVICISGGGRLTSTDYLSGAKLLGASAIFKKPLDEDQLIEKINELLGLQSND
ncbi:MAG: response regulator [Oceanospirillum sp.]|nr:response regulator [Oceanospirillum sp.]